MTRSLLSLVEELHPYLHLPWPMTAARHLTEERICEIQRRGRVKKVRIEDVDGLESEFQATRADEADRLQSSQVGVEHGNSSQSVPRECPS